VSLLSFRKVALEQSSSAQRFFIKIIAFNHINRLIFYTLIIAEEEGNWMGCLRKTSGEGVRSGGERRHCEEEGSSDAEV